MDNPVKIARRSVTLTVDETLIYQAKVRSLQDNILLRDVVEQALKAFLANSRS
jgi:hypothetical protein